MIVLQQVTDRPDRHVDLLMNGERGRLSYGDAVQTFSVGQKLSRCFVLWVSADSR